ncbi:metallophosphoesterase [Arthrobacter sp. MAHUQ-56]|nr:metallophosphoesterase [Arthrobacter sp. MAHUQ-56]
MLPGRRKAAAMAIALLTATALAGCIPGPKPPPERSVHFTAVGDMGMQDGAKAVLDKIKELQPEFNFHLGDLSYGQGTEEEFCKMVTDKLGDLPFQLVAGNHESNGEGGHIRNYVKCLPNKMPGLEGEYGTQWYIDIPQEKPLVRLIAVSPGIAFDQGDLDYSEDSKRWQWTEDAIDGARTDGIPWTVVGMHTVCFSMGEYSCEAGRALTDLLIEKKVDLVLTGHEHIYQRTFQLGMPNDCSKVLARGKCAVDDDDSFAKGAGTVFATSGLGGKSIRDINTQDSDRPVFAAWSGSNKDPAYGTLDIKLTGSRMDVKFVPAEGYSFTDSFSIAK